MPRAAHWTKDTGRPPASQEAAAFSLSPPPLYPRLGRRPAIANRSPRDGPQDPGEPAPRTRALPGLRQPLDDAGDRLESGIRFDAASCLVEMDTPPGWRGVGMRFLSTGPMQESGRIRPNTTPETGPVVNLLVSLEHAAQYGERSVSGQPASIRVLRKPRHDGTYEWVAGRQRPEAIQRALCRNGTWMFEAPERHVGVRSAGTTRGQVKHWKGSAGVYRFIARPSAAMMCGSPDCATLKRRKSGADCETLKTLPGASTTLSARTARARSAPSWPPGRRHHR